MSTPLEMDPGPWRGLSTATVSDAMGRRRTFGGTLRSQTGLPLFGRAYTIQVVVGDSATIHEALQHVPRGAVLVIEAGGFADRAVWGEILTATAQQRGVVGAVINGAVRDIAGIRRRRFALYCAAVVPAGPHKAGGGLWGERISCCGVDVDPGDLIIGDDDGLVAVRWGDRDWVARQARAISEREDRILMELESPSTLDAGT